MGSSSFEIDQLISSMNAQFSLKDLGKLSYFLGIEVSYPSTGGMFLYQSTYIFEVFSKAQMLEAKTISTPMVSGSIVSAYHGENFTDPYLYRSIVGALQYVTLTRPEISVSVNEVCQFMHSPKLVQWQLVKREFLDI